MRNMKFLFVIAFLFFNVFAFAQDSSWRKYNDTGLVKVHKDPRVELLIKNSLERLTA